MIGSYCPWPPLQPQSGTLSVHFAPLSALTLITMYGTGQLAVQMGFGTPYRVARAYTYGACGSAAMAGPQSSAIVSYGCPPPQPGAADPPERRCPARPSF